MSVCLVPGCNAELCLYCWIGRFKPALEHKLPPSMFHHALALICERTQLSLEAEPLSTGGVQMLKNRQVLIQDTKTAEPQYRYNKKILPNESYHSSPGSNIYLQKPLDRNYLFHQIGEFPQQLKVSVLSEILSKSPITFFQTSPHIN